jgi:ribosome biogenesis GTPase / thiamine phosphate phosphatase
VKKKPSPAKLKGKLRKSGSRSTNPVAVGDKVEFYRLEKENTGIITGVLDRKNYIIRKSSKLSKETHVLAANLDQAFLMISLILPRTTLRFIDRFLATSEAYQIPAILIFNKTDLYDGKLMAEMEQLAEMYGNIGYESVKTSAVQKKGIDELRFRMKNKINLVAGNSGVGKSSIINAMDPSWILKHARYRKFIKPGSTPLLFRKCLSFRPGDILLILRA